MSTQKYAIDVDQDGKVDYTVTIHEHSNLCSNLNAIVNSNVSSNVSNISANIVTGPTDSNVSANIFSNANVLSDHDWFKEILYSKTDDVLDSDCMSFTTNDSELQHYPTYDQVLQLLSQMQTSIQTTDSLITSGVKNSQNSVDKYLN